MLLKLLLLSCAFVVGMNAMQVSQPAKSVQKPQKISLKKAQRGKPKPSEPRRQEGAHWYAGHALDRMKERGTTFEMVEDIVANGRRYAAAKGDAFLIYDGTREIAVMFNPKNNIVITVMDGFDDAKLKHWVNMTRGNVRATKKR